MSVIGKIYLHLLIVGPSFYLIGKTNPQFGYLSGLGMTLGLAMAAAGCILGFFFCQEEGKSLTKKPPEQNQKYVSGECQTRKLGLIYVFLGLLLLYFSPLLPPSFRSILAPGGALCGLMGIFFLLASMFYSRKARLGKK